MAIFKTPTLTAEDLAVLDLIREQRERLRYTVVQAPQRWTGFIRRAAMARALQGSNSIEGYQASLSDAAAIVDEEKPETMEEETLRALTGYRNALTYVLQTHDDQHFELNAQVIKSLHFMMLSYNMEMKPGQWRPGGVFVVREPDNETVYEGPDPALVPDLMDELVKSAVQKSDIDPIVRGAMAHLNLAMIHPFKDGNGRMARALQTLVMARDGILSPMFCSIEEWLGRNTEAYYKILGEVGQGSWHPENDAGPWIRFCLRAHYQQAATLIKRIRVIEQVWAEIAALLKSKALHERMGMTLLDATVGWRIRSSRYQKENQVSDVVASRDLKRLTDVGLQVPVGEKRGRYSKAAPPLHDIYERCKDDTKSLDPYDVVHKAAQLQLL